MSSKNLIIQIIKFGFVGIIAAIIDVGLLALFNEVFRIDVLISSAISFCCSVVVNYILSMRFVFDSKEKSKIKEFIIFVTLSVGGLCINQGIMWIGIKLFSIHYLVVKIFAMIFVPIYNFVSRKVLLEKK